MLSSLKLSTQETCERSKYKVINILLSFYDTKWTNILELQIYMKYIFKNHLYLLKYKKLFPIVIVFNNRAL